MTANPLPAPPTTRFAPSPTGYLHLGHAYAALYAERAARGANGRFLLRIEDLDRSRARPHFEDAIFEDLAWLGLTWDGPVLRQSERFAHYTDALARLKALGVLYPCFCTRRAIAAEVAAAATAPHGPDGALYPGTCRGLAPAERDRRIAEGIAFAVRLDWTGALARTRPLAWTDRRRELQRVPAAPAFDPVLARKDTPASYHLAVVVDDAAEGVTLVTRGNDLIAATHVHRVLQALLGLAEPAYDHHALLRDAGGARLAKRDGVASLRDMRAAGQSAAEVRAAAWAAGEEAEARGNAAPA